MTQLPPAATLIRHLRRAPSPEARAWAARSVGSRAVVTAWKRMPGGISTAVHRLTIDEGGGRRGTYVLRRWVVPELAHEATAAIAQEATVLRALERHPIAGVHVPTLIAAAPEGIGDGMPALLMRRVPGRVDLQPADFGSWLGHLANVLPSIHEAQIAGGPFESWLDLDEAAPPPLVTDVARWHAALDVVRAGPPSWKPVFVHRDYQPFNVLCQRGKAVSVIDWVHGCNGPADIDVAHCRLNLAMLFSAEAADRFCASYEAVAGRELDPWWDLHSLVGFRGDPRGVLQLQIGGTLRYDEARATAAVEALLARALRRV